LWLKATSLKGTRVGAFPRDAYRAHDPRWSFTSLSGDGAALYGGRYNRKGVPALCAPAPIVRGIT
jgi:RES domain-containing protein